METLTTKEYITVAEFLNSGGKLSQDRLLYFYHPVYGFDSCSEVRHNKIEGIENEFYVKIEI